MDQDDGTPPNRRGLRDSAIARGAGLDLTITITAPSSDPFVGTWTGPYSLSIPNVAGFPTDQISITGSGTMTVVISSNGDGTDSAAVTLSGLQGGSATDSSTGDQETVVVASSPPTNALPAPPGAKLTIDFTFPITITQTAPGSMPVNQPALGEVVMVATPLGNQLAMTVTNGTGTFTLTRSN